MKYKTIDDDYVTVRISYPEELSQLCPVCSSPVIYRYPDNGKRVHTLKGTIYQVRNLYRCTNPACKLSGVDFNCAPRLDYSARTYGRDVFQEIAEDMLIINLKPIQIYAILTHKHDVVISEDTVGRMMDDVMLIKASTIDRSTRERIQAQGFILLGFDGQDPGEGHDSLWMFKDMVLDRVLYTEKYSSLSYTKIRDIVAMIEATYQVPIIGWISDKQGMIVKAHNTFFSSVPHQYCQFHFLRNLWRHLEALDSNIFAPLKAALNDLYVHNANANVKVMFEQKGKESVRTVFAPLDADFQKLTRLQNKTFERLRGLELFDTLETLIIKMKEHIKHLPVKDRFTIILQETQWDLEAIIAEVTPLVSPVRFLNSIFQELRSELSKPHDTRASIETSIDLLFQRVWEIAHAELPKLDFDKLKSFLPSKKKTVLQVMGEWCRLWNSYLPGLFSYFLFPASVKTNNGCESSFGLEKTRIISRVGRGNASGFIETHGEYYLRFANCEKTELSSDIMKEYQQEVLSQLQIHFKGEKQDLVWKQFRSTQNLQGLDIAVKDYVGCD